MCSNCKRCWFRHGCPQFDCIDLLQLGLITIKLTTTMQKPTSFAIGEHLQTFLLVIPYYDLIVSNLKPSNNLNFQVWRCAPIAKGVGFGMVVLSLIVSIYYNVIMAYSIFYVGASFYGVTGDLPWTYCGKFYFETKGPFINSVKTY